MSSQIPTSATDDQLPNPASGFLAGVSRALARTIRFVGRGSIAGTVAVPSVFWSAVHV